MRLVSESLKKFGLDKLDVEQRLALIEEIWNSIDADESIALQLSDSQRAELRERLLEDDANPDDTVAWEEMKRGGK
ncbi:MAG TPA: addiction module protein [Steroidobacteraceae bacterium]|nr:addiction module protein [Steroidobacteraceae bacterium]